MIGGMTGVLKDVIPLVYLLVMKLFGRIEFNRLEKKEI